VVSAEEAQAKVLWPQILNQWAVVAPALEEFKAGATAVTDLRTAVADLVSKVDAVAGAEDAKVEAAVRALVIPGVLKSPPSDPAAEGQVA
jgi:hypothetical protein